MRALPAFIFLLSLEATSLAGPPAPAKPAPPPAAAKRKLTLTSLKTESGGVEEWTKFVTSQLADVQSCFDKELAAAPGVKGDFHIQFDVNYMGEAERMAVPPNTFPDQPRIGICVIGRVQHWAYPIAPATKVELVFRYD